MCINAESISMYDVVMESCVNVYHGINNTMSTQWYRNPECTVGNQLVGSSGKPLRSQAKDSNYWSNQLISQSAEQHHGDFSYET